MRNSRLSILIAVLAVLFLAVLGVKKSVHFPPAKPPVTHTAPSITECKFAFTEVSDRGFTVVNPADLSQSMEFDWGPESLDGWGCPIRGEAFVTSDLPWCDQPDGLTVDQLDDWKYDHIIGARLYNDCDGLGGYLSIIFRGSNGLVESWTTRPESSRFNDSDGPVEAFLNSNGVLYMI